MDKIAVLSNININPVVKLLGRDYTVYEVEGYGNELEMMMNGSSSLRAFQPDAIFLIEDLAELINHELSVKAAGERIREWFGIFEKNLFSNCYYFVSDAYLYSVETLLSGMYETVYQIEQIWNTKLHELIKRNANVSVFPYRRMISAIGEGKAFSAKMWYMGKIPHTLDAHKRIASEVKRLMRVRSYTPKKVLVLDLDNTIWGGLAGEEGLASVILSDDHEGLIYKNTQRVIKLIKDTGAVLCIASKNNPEDANNIIEHHPHMVLLPDDFVIKEINWADKASSIKHIAAKLNVGLDSVVFVDDSDHERQLVKELLPEVEVPEFPKAAEELPRFMAGIYEAYFAKARLTQEDKAKTEAYLANARREELKSGAGSFEGYLRKLDIRVEKVDAGKHTERILQLVNKTNQFNLTTKRYTMQQMQDAVAGDKTVYAFRVKDRFGDNGIVAVIIIDWDGGIPMIEEFTMSCRVMGRNIENGLLDYVEEDLQKKGYGSLGAVYIPTKKNLPVAGLYEGLGYHVTKAEKGIKHYIIQLNGRPGRDYQLTFMEEEEQSE